MSARAGGGALLALVILTAAAAADRLTTDGPAGATTQVARAAEYAPSEVLVRFKPGTGRHLDALLRTQGATITEKLPVPGLRRVQLPRGRSVASAARALERMDDVLYAEPNYYLRPAAVANDPGVIQQWAIQNRGQPVPVVRAPGSEAGPAKRRGTPDADIDAPQAWKLSVGSPKVKVAVIDTGIAYDHPDLARNMWTNPRESGLDGDGRAKQSNGLDDDANGYVDDWRGWDFTASGDNDPLDLDGHGTHVAATLGARGGNRRGIAGVAWKVTLIPLRLGLRRVDAGTAAQAVAYAAQQGARVATIGLATGRARSKALDDAIAAAPRTLFVVPAGNRSADNDRRPQAPCNGPGPTLRSAPNVVCVAATDQRDRLAPYSNFGESSVDLGAPGTSILSATPASNTILEEGFETGAAGWTTGGVRNTWGVEAAPGGGHVLNESKDGPYPFPSACDLKNFDLDFEFPPPCIESWAASPSVPIAAGGACEVGLDLDFDVRFADVLRIEVARGEGAWTTLAEHDGSGPRRKALRILDELPPGPAGTLRLRFYWVSEFGNSDVPPPPPSEPQELRTAEGISIDNVAITCAVPDYRGVPQRQMYAYRDGTSFAAPHVAGVAALYLGRYPKASVRQVKRALLTGVDRKRSLAGKVRTGGRLNAHRTLRVKPRRG